MAACAEFVQACQAWAALAQAERTAIKEGNWRALEDSQDRLAMLRQRMSQLPYDPHDQVCKSSIAELIGAEKENALLLGDQLHAVQEQIGQIRASHRRLNEIRSSYGAGQSTEWSSVG